MLASKIPLTSLPRALAQAYPGAAVTYRRLYHLAVDGHLPATQEHNGRWFLARADLPAVARMLGLQAAPAKAPKVRAAARAVAAPAAA